jgi:chromosome segregation ATPase
MDDVSPQQEAEKLAARSATALRALEDRARSALAASREQVSRLEAEITGQLESLAATIDTERAAESQNAVHESERRAEIDRLSQETERLTRELDESRAAALLEQTELETARDELLKQRDELASQRDELLKQRDELTTQRDQLAAQHDDFAAERDKLTAERDELIRQVSELQGELQVASDDSDHRAEIERLNKQWEESRGAWLAEQSTWEAERDELTKQIAKQQSEERAARDDWARQLAEFEQKLREQQTAWNAQRTEWASSRASLELERDSLQQKFELALQDVQRFRARVAELEQELSSRPEPSHADSAELVALRAERDALAERVEQLELQPATAVDANSDQQRADLQRRFELAVEDVRELKTKNAQLEAQLAAGGKSAGRATDSGGSLDWEAQKRRLLASLEDEGEAADEPERHEERVRIESTIEMTDTVVAEKDREIAELKEQLAQGGGSVSRAAEEEQEQKLRELVDADEVIAQHRQRVSELEREMQEKLRAAELELSLERAKIARERVQLDELRADIEVQRADIGAGGAAAPGAPRRRWLSKLGLSGEEQ